MANEGRRDVDRLHAGAQSRELARVLAFTATNIQA